MERKPAYTIAEYKDQIEVIAKSNKDQFSKNALICLRIYRISVLIGGTKENQTASYKSMFNKYKDSGYIREGNYFDDELYA